MTLFNSNTKVTVKDNASRSANAEFRRFSGRFTDVDHMSSLTESAIAEEQAIMESKEAFRSALDSERANKTFFNSSYPKKLSELTDEGRHYIFESVMSCLVADSLVFPNEFKNFFKENIVKESSEYFRDKLELLESNRDKNIYLDALCEAVDKHARKCASERCKECNSLEQLKAVKFSMTKEEKSDLLKDIKGVNFGNITSMVKDKVLAVVKDEQKRAEQRKALDEKIKSKVEDETAEQIKKAEISDVTESFGFKRNHKYESKSTLFESLMNSVLKESIVAVSKNPVRVEEDDEDSDADLNEDSIQASKSYEEISKDIRKVNEFEGASNKPAGDFGGNEHPTDDEEHCVSEEPCDCPECSAERDNLYASSDNAEDTKNNEELDNIGGLESCGDNESCDEKKESKCCNSCGAEIQEGCVCEKCEEALNIKSRIHKRAKKFQNKIMKKATRESNEVDLDGVMLEAITLYTMAELSHTLNLESFNTSKVSELVRSNMEK